MATCMTFRRLRAWPRVGGGLVDYGQQSSLATFLTIIFTILVFSIFVDGLCMNNTTSSDGCLGSNNDEGCSEVWQALCIAGISEPTESWTHIALSVCSWKHVCFSVCVFLRCVSLRCHVFVFSCFNVAFDALTYVSWWCWTCATLNIFFRSDVTCDQAVPVFIFKPKAWS